jgi:hypothetical protein
MKTFNPLYKPLKNENMQQDDKFSETKTEHLRIENELLRLKLKAQYGDAFHMESNDTLPPEIENQFLRNIIALEDANEETEITTVYEKLGKPFYRPADQLTVTEISTELDRLTGLLEENNLNLGFCYGPYPDKEIYRFITEELFAHETSMSGVEGMTWNFIYEEFHPNNKADIERNTDEFFKHWSSRSFDDFSGELDYNFITPGGKQMKREELYKKMMYLFESFQRFENDGYNIDAIDVAEQPDGTAMGFSEGTYKYDAVMDNGETQHYQGPYKLYMRREDNYWSIFYFVMPGFVWS